MTRTIAQIDQDIDANRAELHSRVTIEDVYSAEAWQAAWDSQPVLRDREADLFHERGEAQQERDRPSRRIRIPRPIDDRHLLDGVERS